MTTNSQNNTSLFPKPHAPLTRKMLAADYLDYVNNYLSLEKYAEHRGLLIGEARMLVDLGQSCHENLHPEA